MNWKRHSASREVNETDCFARSAVCQVTGSDRGIRTGPRQRIDWMRRFIKPAHPEWLAHKRDPEILRTCCAWRVIDSGR